MAPLLPNAQKHSLRRLAQEIHSATACLSASRGAICKQVGLNVAQWRALAAIDRSTFVLSISDLARLVDPCLRALPYDPRLALAGYPLLYARSPSERRRCAPRPCGAALAGVRRQSGVLAGCARSSLAHARDRPRRLRRRSGVRTRLTAGSSAGVDPGEFRAPGEIRTPDPQVRSLMLYPTELRARRADSTRDAGQIPLRARLRAECAVDRPEGLSP